MRIVCLLWAVVLSAAAAPQQYVVSTVAGGAPPPLTRVAAQALVELVAGVAADSSGNVYFSAENCVFKIDSTGEMTRIAGNGRLGYSGDGGPATSAQLSMPGGLALDAQGNLYIADSGNEVIRRVTPAGVIATVPGSAIYPGQGYSSPVSSVAVAASGDIFISNRYSNAVWKLSPSGALSRFAGNGTSENPANAGDGGPAALASVGGPLGVAVDATGNVFIVQSALVRKVSKAGIIASVAGTGISGESGDGGPATQAQLSNAMAIAVDSAGALYIAETGRIRKVSSVGIITTIAGGGGLGDGGPATSARLIRASGVAVTPGGDMYIADNTRIRHVSASGTIESIEGNGVSFTGDGGPATSAQLSVPSGIALDASGNLYVADNGSRIRKVSANGTITTFAGGETQGYSGDGGPATAAQMQVYPLTGMAVDPAGDLFVVEQVNSDVRKISAQGVISTVVGPGGPGYTGDGGPATKAQMSFPSALAIDGNGNLFIADSGNGVVRRVDSAGKISTFAGNRNNSPYAIAVDGANNVYVSYSDVFGLTKYSPGGTPTELAPAVFPQEAIAVDAAGNIYAFTGAELVKIAPDGNTMAIGTITYQFPLDGAPAVTGSMMAPSALAVDSIGNVFVADSGANAIFKLSPATGSLPPAISYVLHGASGMPQPVAPGEIVTLYGAGMGPADLVTARLDEKGLLGTTLGGAQVLFDGKPAPLVYVSATQSAAIVPYEVSGSTVVTVSYSGQVSAPLTLPVALTAPALFSANLWGYGQAAATNEDGSLNSAARPAAIGDVITLFATGEGQTMPAGIDGKLAGNPAPSPLLPVTLTIGGPQAAVVYAGGAPGSPAGVMQINARIPAGITAGDAVPVVLQVGDVQTPQSVTIAVR